MLVGVGLLCFMVLKLEPMVAFLRKRALIGAIVKFIKYCYNYNGCMQSKLQDISSLLGHL